MKSDADERGRARDRLPFFCQIGNFPGFPIRQKLKIRKVSIMEKAIKRYFPIFVLPTMIAFTLGFIIPFVEGVYLSFCKFTTVNDAKFIGLCQLCQSFYG